MTELSGTKLWHPFGRMGVVRENELMITRGEGVFVWDADDNRYFDATSSLWYAAVGHGRDEIRQAVDRQMAELASYHVFNDYANKPAVELAERLVALSPVGPARVFFGSGGGDGIETAVKLARRYWAQQGFGDRNHIITRSRAYHGMHGYGTSLVGIPGYQDNLGPMDPATTVVAYDSIDELRAAVEKVGADKVAAIIAEPVIGSGGVLAPPDGYLKALAELCRETGILFVADEVICGFGRLGEWFGSQRWGVEPDMIVFAKGVSSGYLPIGGTIISDKVAAPFFDQPDAPMFMHGATYAGHPACCAAALANMDILENEGLVTRGRELEGALEQALLDATSGQDIVAEVRAGTGLMGAVEFTPEALAAYPNLVPQLFQTARRSGLLIRPLGTAICMSPPLTTEQEHFDLLTEALGSAIESVASEVRSAA
jgi:adenosylmethionine-8-amino-7-oxononanoate aminotransferase